MSLKPVRSRLGLFLLILAGAGLRAAPEAIDVGSGKQLFVDDRFIESSDRVRLTLNPPWQDRRILLEPDQDWEGPGQGGSIGLYSSVLKENGKIRIWYDQRQYGEDRFPDVLRVCYAESDDGLVFVKPRLGLHESNGSRQNNIVIPGKIGGSSVWIDPHASPEHRYKTQAKVYPSAELHLHTSPDGIRWKLFSKLDPGPGGWDTQSIIFWDPPSSRYLLFTRYWTRFDDRNRNFRSVRRLESRDLVHWTNQSIVVDPDAIDRATHATPTGQPPVDYYGADVFRYEEADQVYILLAQAFWHWKPRPPVSGLGPSAMDVRLLVSRDGKRFRRVGERKPFLRMGPPGSFDSARVWALPHPVRMGDEIWIYYNGSNRDHDYQLDSESSVHRTGISRAVMRLDGFVSVDAPYGGGRFTTPPIRFSGSRLELNLDTGGGGEARVEVLDDTGQPVPGFSRDEALPLNGNSVRLPVRWKGDPDLKKLAGESVRLRFHLQDCKLYAFQFKEIDGAAGAASFQAPTGTGVFQAPDARRVTRRQNDALAGGRLKDVPPVGT